MSRTLLTRAFIVACLGGCVTSGVRAETKVRPYPDPGYARLGVYGGGPASHFDYCVAKIFLPDEFPNKKQWWAGLKAERQALPGSSKINIYTLYLDLKSAEYTFEIGKRRVDAWLKPEPGVETYPQLIPAVCLEEENEPHRDKKRLEELARYVRSTYGIAVFQWWSPYLVADPGLTADGWIFDHYFSEYPDFRKRLMKHVVLDKPVINMLWATDPAWDSYAAGRFADTAALMTNVDDQFRTCMEFNVSTAAFAVASRHGSVNAWLGSSTPDMIRLRNWLATKRKQMRAFGPGDLPLASANFSDRARYAVAVGGDPEEPSVYEEDFSSFRWIDDADLTGFLDLKLASLPEREPGVLLAKTRAARPVEATLTYRFESYFPLQRVEVKLAGAAPAASRSRNQIALSLDEQDWSLKAEQAGNDDVQPVLLKADETFLVGRRTFFLRITMTNNAQADGAAANVLDRLVVRSVHKAPSNAAGRFAEHYHGILAYADDFSTQRWKPLGQVNVSHATHGGYNGSGFWIGMVGGSAASTKLVQRFTAPRQLKALTVTVRGRVNSRDLGGGLVLGVAPRGGQIQWRTGTADLPRGIHDTFVLKLPPEALVELRDFDVHVILRSTSGVEGGAKACASLGELSLRAE